MKLFFFIKVQRTGDTDLDQTVNDILVNNDSIPKRKCNMTIQLDTLIL